MALNRSNIRKVALAVLNNQKKQGETVGYNQDVILTDGMGDNSGHMCGSVACIAGHAALLAGARIGHTSDGSPFIKGEVFKKACKFMGLKPGQADELFPSLPGYRDKDDRYHNLRGVTAAEAALVLFNLAQTGKVDWSIVDASRSVNG